MAREPWSGLGRKSDDFPLDKVHKGWSEEKEASFASAPGKKGRHPRRSQGPATHPGDQGRKEGGTVRSGAKQTLRHLDSMSKPGKSHTTK